LEVALLRTEPDEGIDQLAVSRAVLEVLRVLARSRTTLVAIDDLQWLDAASARVLIFAVRRLAAEPVGLLATLRIERPGPLPFDLEHAIPQARLARLRLPPLPVGILDLLLRDRYRLELAWPTLIHLHRMTAGNPLYALEVARALPPAATMIPGGALTVPPNLTALLRARLSKLSKAGQTASLAASLVARPTVTLLERLSEQPADEVAQPAWQEAVDAEVLEREGELLRFTHPLLASVIEADATDTERREMHQRLARLVTEPEARAWHRALGAEGPDEEIASVVDAAAARAGGRGAPEAAALFADQACRLTPAGNADAQLQRTLAAADYHLMAGDGPRCRLLLNELVAKLAPGPDRAQALLRLAESVTDDSAVALCEQALAEAGSDPALLVRIRRTLGILHGNTGDLLARQHDAEDAVATAEQIGDEQLLVSALADLSYVRFLRGFGVQREFSERALALQYSARRLPAIFRPALLFARQLMWTDDLDAARLLLQGEAQHAIEQADLTNQANLLMYLAELEILAGNWALADRYADEGLELIRPIDAGNMKQGLVYTRALVDAHLGRVEAARSAAEEAIAAARARKDEFHRIRNVIVLGFLELSLGDPVNAHARLGPLPEALRSMGVGEPGVYPVLPNEIEALVALNELDHAERLADELEERGRALDRPWALATAARCRGLLAAAHGDLEIALAWLERALNEHKRLSHPFELGRTLRAHGMILRRDKQKAAASRTLGQALALFERLGASLWAESTRAELDRVGLRRTISTGLTEAEAKVAELVATGCTNREVASALFMSPKTVEAHLAHIYRKLGIRSRTELAQRVAGAAARRQGDLFH
jgi:DNA-binding CsgD family transcriptional regulator